jgi:hypothetical protein
MHPRDAAKYPIIQEVEEGYESDNSLSSEIKDTPQETETAPLTYQANPGAVSMYDEQRARHYQTTFQDSIRQKTKTTDDSKTAYGEGFASSFGQRNIAPMPEPGAPPLEDDEWQEYQAWMHAGTFADRTKFKNHERFSGIIGLGQGALRLHDISVLKDTVSENFYLKAATNTTLFAGSGLPPGYSEMEEYVPVAFKAQIRRAGAQIIDQVQEMIDFSDKEYKTTYLTGMVVGQEIPSNRFYAISDHSGESSGRDLQLWGPGTKQSLTVASSSAGKNLGKVAGAEASYSATTDYAHVANRFTIIRIYDNELGFVLDRNTNVIKKMKQGRYVIQEKDFAYLGKAAITPTLAAIIVRPHSGNKDEFVTQLAKLLEVILVTPGKIGFVKDNTNTYLLTPRAQPYILDKRRAENFINFANNNQQIIRATDNSYTIINQLQPGQFIVFQQESKTVVWHYDAKNPQYNTLHLPATHYMFDGNIHTRNENHFTWQNTNFVNMKPGQTLIVRDQTQQVRFIEKAIEATVVLRTPWEFLGLISQNLVDYRAGSKEAGNEVVRLMLRSSEWAAVIDRRGHLAFYPPRLDNQPYYFLQPEHTVVQVINKNTLGETRLEVPGIGNVSVVNIPSGSIGACRLRNMHFFLNPSDVPYVFVPPDAFIKIIDAKQAHNQIEDLHRIVLKPDERAVISKDGKLYRLPHTSPDDSRELSEENGIYVFRSFQLEMYGPEKKSNKQYTLGPIQYFNVGVGEVAYGTLEQKLKIWNAGEHSVDNRRNEWFTNFFSTNVDPVEIDKLPVTFQHGITGTVGVYVSYRIVDSEKAIHQFRDHETLHQFISKTTQSEMIKLCASRPPLGYTDLYFSTQESKSQNEGSTEDASKAVHEIEDSFMMHAAELLDEYGVRISKMYIDSWALAEDFVKQVQANAKLLQDAHAKVEQTRMGLQQSQLENEKEIQRGLAEIKLKENENQRLKLELDATQLRMASTNKAQADAKLEAAKAQTAIDVAQAEGRAKIAVHDANGKTAGQKVESEINKAIAQNKFDAKELEIKAALLVINSEKSRGMNDAEIIAAKELARFAGLTPEQRMQLQFAEIQAKNAGELIGMLLKTGVQMPGAMTLDPAILQLLRVPVLMTPTTVTPTGNPNPFMMFSPPVSRPLSEHKQDVQVLQLPGKDTAEVKTLSLTS